MAIRCKLEISGDYKISTDFFVEYRDSIYQMDKWISTYSDEIVGGINWIINNDLENIVDN